MRPRSSAVWVDTGDGVERHVWCGAFNIAPATSCRSPRRHRDARRSRHRARGILGIDSEGMLCSARELGLGRRPHRHPDPAAGHAARRAVRRRRSGSHDEVLDLDLTRNRPTAGATSASPATSAPKLGARVHAAATPALTVSDGPRLATVDIVDGERCPRFTTIVLSGVDVGPAGVDGRAASRPRGCARSTTSST